MWLAREKQADAGRSARRRFPIHFYSGRNGAGKSLCMVYDTLPSLEAGRPVLSTVRLIDYIDLRACITELGCDRPDWHGEFPEPHQVAHPLYRPFTSWEQLLDASGCDILMDEITGVADSNDHFSMPSAVRNILPQLRRRDIALRITGLNWIRADKRIRESVNALTRCRSSLPVRAKDADGETRLWRPRRLMHAVTYDAQSLPLDDHTAGAYAKADVVAKARIWIPGSVAIKAYDTLAPVLSVGTVTDAGRCAFCGGTRRAPECCCPDYVEDRAERKAARSPRSGEHGRRPHGLPEPDAEPARAGLHRVGLGP